LQQRIPARVGHWGDTQKASTCTPVVVTKYQKRISDLLLDRIDIHIEIPRVDYERYVVTGWWSQVKRFAKECKPQETFNDASQSTTQTSFVVPLCASREIRQFCKLQAEGQSLMEAAMTQLNLSAHAYHRILKLARTKADPARSEESHFKNPYSQYNAPN